MACDCYKREEELKFFKEVCEDLRELHKIKSETYQDSWCSRGEMVSVFGNVARKFDRIEKIITDPEKWISVLAGNTNEQIEDTVIDLAVYSLLWCVYMKQHRPSKYAQCLTRNIGKEQTNEKGIKSRSFQSR